MSTYSWFWGMFLEILAEYVISICLWLGPDLFSAMDLSENAVHAHSQYPFIFCQQTIFIQSNITSIKIINLHLSHEQCISGPEIVHHVVALKSEFKFKFLQLKFCFYFLQHNETNLGFLFSCAVDAKSFSKQSYCKKHKSQSELSSPSCLSVE